MFRRLTATCAIIVIYCIAAAEVRSGEPTSSNPIGLVERIARLESRVQSLEKRVNEGFSIGAIVFCLSGTPGPGWVPADGQAAFGNEQHIPVDLRGKQVPDMRDALVAIGPEIGLRVQGSLGVQTVKGENFTLPKPTDKRIQEGKGNATNPGWIGGNVGVLTANADYLRVQAGVAGWQCFGGHMEAYPAIYQYHPQGTPILGSVNIKPPSHVFLRAYVRVR
jgi:hypothetical protein